MHGLLALLLFAAPLQGASNQTDRPRFCDAKPSAIPELVAAIAALPDFRSRLLAASESFLGVPYQFDPLGEGPGQPPDEDPRLRFDKVDCQTFLETALAIAHAKKAEDLLPILDDIRYDGPPGYERRNHFFEAHWVAANTRKGYVRDATAAIAGKDAVAHTKVVEPQQWKERTFAASIALPDDRAPIGRFPVTYVPLGKVLAHARSIPSGTLLAVVREDQPNTPSMVSHLGMFVQKKNGTFVRHAGSGLYNQVVDEEVAHFVARNAKFAKWKVLGFELLEPLERPAP